MTASVLNFRTGPDTGYGQLAALPSLTQGQVLAVLDVSNGWARLQWSVLDWNTPSITFYKSLGAELMDDWTLCKVTGLALKSLAGRAS